MRLSKQVKQAIFDAAVVKAGIPEEFIKLFGKPLSLSDSLAKQLKSAQDLLNDDNSTKEREGGEA